MVPVFAALWLIRDRKVTKLIKKELARHHYKVLSVNETRRRFSFTCRRKEWHRYVVFDKGGTTELTSFREVIYKKGNETFSCLAAVYTDWFASPQIFFDVDIKTTG
jgi:hypothetical protein